MADPPSLPAIAGTQIDPLTGQATTGISLGAVPGDIPVPLSYRTSVTTFTQRVETWGKPPIYGPPPPNYNPPNTLQGFNWVDRPAYGTIHFGYISNGAYCQGYQDPQRYVLEDGRTYQVADLVPYTNYHSALSLPQDFGLSAKAPSAVQITNDFGCVVYTASASDLGNAYSKVIRPSGFPSAGNTYMVVMDKDRARIFTDAYGFGFVPVLWLDRFGHFVSFKWNYRSGVAGANAIYSVDVLNAKSRGVHVEWADYAASSTVQDLVLVDYIGMDGPSLRVKGYPGVSSGRPAGLQGSNTSGTPWNGIRILPPAVAGPIGRPTQIQMGAPGTLPNPAWASAGPRGGNADRTWTFAWDQGNSLMVSMLDPQGLRTEFTGFAQKVFETGDNTSTTLTQKPQGVYFWAVTAQRQTDTSTGTVRNRSWNRTSDNHVILRDVFGDISSALRELDLGYTSTNAQFAANAALTESTLYQVSGGSRGKKLEWTGNTLSSWGLDASYSTPTATSAGRDGELAPNTTVARIDSISPLPSSVTRTASGQTDTTYYGYESGAKDKLMPTRLASSQAYNEDLMTYYHYNGKGLVTDQQKGRFSPTSGYSYDAGTYNTWDEASGRLISTCSAAVGSKPASPLNQKSFAYDAEGRLQSTTTTYATRIGQSGTSTVTESLEYDTAWRVTRATDGRGVSTTSTYDYLGRATNVARDGQASVTTSYSNRSKTVSVAGTSSTEEWDAFGRVTRRVGADGVEVSYTYDALGRVRTETVKSKSGQLRTTTTSYDELDRPIRVDLPNGSYRTLAYEVKTGPMSGDSRSFSVVTITTYGAGQALTTVTYKDLRGRVIYSKDAKGNITKYDYATTRYTGNGDRLVQVTRYAANSTSPVETPREYDYDFLTGSLVWTRGSEVGEVRLASTNNLRLPESMIETGLDGSSRRRTLVYDGLGRRVEMNNGNDKLTWTYSGLDLVSSTSVSNGVTVTKTYAYKITPGRMLDSESTQLDNEPTKSTTSYGYNDNGLLTSMGYPSGRQVTYGYDSLNRLASVSTNGSGVIATVEYGAWGERRKLNYASGVSDSWDLDGLGLNPSQWTLASGGGQFSTQVRSYAYDGLNRITTAGEWQQIGHDELGHLISANFNRINPGDANHSVLNGADSRDNAIYGAVNAGTAPVGSTNFSMSLPASNRIPGQADGGALTGWSYDGFGEASQVGLAQGSTKSLSLFWDGLGRVNRVVRPSMDPARASDADQSYVYDAEGLRARLMDAADSSRNRRYVYASGGLLLGEWSSGGWRDVIYFGGQAVAEVNGAGIHELHSDHLGTPRIVTRGSGGTIEGRQCFGAFGETMVNTDGDNVYKPLTGYTGHIQTDATGLIYMRGRYYSPAWHRFVSSDYGADPNSLNQYAYVVGSPFMKVDPSGMDYVNVEAWQMFWSDGGNTRFSKLFQSKDQMEQFGGTLNLGIKSYEWYGDYKFERSQGGTSSVTERVTAHLYAGAGSGAAAKFLADSARMMNKDKFENAAWQAGIAQSESSQTSQDRAFISTVVAIERGKGQVAAAEYALTHGGIGRFTNSRNRNGSYTCPFPSSQGPIDLDWYSTLVCWGGSNPRTSATAPFSWAMGMGLYAGGKMLWEGITLVHPSSREGDGSWSFEGPFRDPGERVAASAYANGLRYCDLFPGY